MALPASAVAASAVIGKITVTPAEFQFVQYDAAEISALVADLAERLGVANPIHLIVDETTPLAKTSAELESASSDTTIVIRAESGALENTKRFTTFGPNHARESIGRMLLRASDRLRDDFADTPPDLELSLEENAAWDSYCAGRMAQRGYAIIEQRWRYNYRNRFGFSDATDAAFDHLWAATDLGWSDLTNTAV